MTEAEEVGAGGEARVTEVLGRAPVAAEREHAAGYSADLQLAFGLTLGEG